MNIASPGYSMDKLQLTNLLASSTLLQALVQKAKMEIFRLGKSQEESQEILRELLGLGGSRPKHWSPNSIAGYYSDKYAKILMGWVKKLDTDKDVLLSCSKMGKSQETIINQISQAWQWILDNPPKESSREQMLDLKNKTEYRKCPDGIIFQYKKVKDTKGEVIPSQETKDAKWRLELLEFIETGVEGQMLDIEGIRLEDKDLDYIAMVINGIDDLVPLVISGVRLKIVKSKFLYGKLMA